MSELAHLIESIAKLDTAAWPIQEMKEVIAFGTQAAGPVVSCLKEGEPADELPFIVILGMIGSPETVPALIDYMKDIRKSAEAAAAEEGLARIGAPAFSALREIAEYNTSVPARVMAYGALGYMQLSEAYEFLSQRFDADPDAADAVAMALSLYGIKEDVDRLYARYASLPPGFMRNNFEEAVHFCAHPDAMGIQPLKEEWSIRYRRLPELDHFPVPSPFELIALLHAGQPRQEDDEPVKKLEDIVSHREMEGYDACSCGESYEEEPMENRTGIAVCFEDLPTIIMFQKSLLNVYMDNGCLTVQQAYDFLDTFYDRIADEKDEKQQGQQEEVYNIGCATADYLLRRGIHELSKGREKLESIERLVMDEYKERFGHYPSDELFSGLTDETAEGPGRNDPCPCGSGKKYKKCCGQ